jgi:hypothetical protein
VPGVSLDDLAVVLEDDGGLGVALALQLQHGGRARRHDGIAVLDHQRRLLRFAVQLVHRTCRTHNHVSYPEGVGRDRYSYSQ